MRTSIEYPSSMNNISNKYCYSSVFIINDKCFLIISHLDNDDTNLRRDRVYSSYINFLNFS